jgi:hypothetical protein
MASHNESPTLPQSIPVEDPDAITPAPPLTADEQTESDMKDTASNKYATSGNAVSLLSGDTVDSPVSPKTPIPPRQYNFDRNDEKEFHHYITKAHTCVRQGHLTASADKDKDITKLSEMVSQMTHLLAASGIVCYTTSVHFKY